MQSFPFPVLILVVSMALAAAQPVTAWAQEDLDLEPVADPDSGSNDELIIEDDSIHERAHHVDGLVHLGFWGRFNLGIGAWYHHVILPDGFLDKLNDEVSVLGGVNIDYYSDNFGFCSITFGRITPMAGIQWDFHFTEQWTAYGNLKAGYGFGFAGSGPCGIGSFSTFEADVAAGAYWNFTEGMAVRMEIGRFGLAGGLRIDL